MAHDDDNDIPSFSSDAEEARYWKDKVNDLHDTLSETQAMLQDFAENSKELEAEMEREIQDSNKKLADLQYKNEALRADVDTWKSKYQNALSEHNKTLADLNKEVEVLRDAHNIYKTRVRDMELVNDELESAERMVQSSLVDMEGRYNKAIERTALLEEELVAKTALEEENQRLKDEIRELNEELAVVRNMTPSLSRAQSRSDGPVPVADDLHASIEADLNLSDLVVNRPMSSASSASVGQQSASSGAARAERALSSNTTITSKARPTGSVLPSHTRSNLGHTRRGSHDVRGHAVHDTTATANAPRQSTSASTSRGVQSTRLARPLGSTTTTRRPGVLPASDSTGGAQRMVKDMMARMKTLETRINSAKNLSRLPRSSLASSTSSRYGLGDVPSAIPRPSSRLGSSTGPGAAGGAANFTPRASMSATRRDSVDGRPTPGSGIPIPSGGLARSTLGPRPSSRLSSAGRDTPPLPNSNGATSPSDEHFFASAHINHNSASSTTPFGKTLNRKRSTTGGSNLISKPRQSGSALPLPSVSMLKTPGGLSRLSTGMMDREGTGSESGHERFGRTTVGHGSGAGGGNAGPPSSWMTRIGAVPPVPGAGAAGGGSGSSGAGSGSSTTTVGLSARPRSSSGARPGLSSTRR